jgi:hypothetical protein
MLDDGALAVSLPALELQAFRPPASVFSTDDLAAAEFSSALSIAVELVTGICRESGFEPTFVARPEIFTHGESRAWLAERLGGVKDHLALSDGTTIRLIPGLRNHVFLFGLGRAADGEALQLLERRAPELFGSLHSQVNTALQFGKRRVTPAPLAIAGVDALEPEAPQFVRVAINADSPEDSFHRTLRTGALLHPARRFSELEYVELTETSLNDLGFAKLIAEKLNLVYFDARRGLILRLPPNAGASSKVEDRIRAVVSALVSARACVPLAASDSALLATGDVSSDRLAGIADVSDFVVHDSFDFWRHSPESYRAFRSIKVHARAGRIEGESFAAIVEAMTGRAVEMVWRNLDDERFSL